MRLYLPVCLLLFFVLPVWAQNYKVIESDDDHIKIEFNFAGKFSLDEKTIDNKKITFIGPDEYSLRNSGEPGLPDYNIKLAIPFNSNPSVKVLSVEQDKRSNILIMPYPDSANQVLTDYQLNKDIYNSARLFPLNTSELKGIFTFRYSRLAGLSAAPFQYNPVSRELVINKKIVVEVNYNRLGNTSSGEVISDIMTEQFISTAVVNPAQAKRFMTNSSKSLISARSLSDSSYWYNPAKDYYKIYLNKKGVYRLSYDYLVSNGVPASAGLEDGKLELLCNGESIPIDVTDKNSDGRFNSGDYFTFIGTPPASSDYTYYNIYNNENVYWFSYQADSVYNYKQIDGYPKVTSNIQISSLYTIHFEKDSIQERLGYAPDDKRDFWFWGSAEARNGLTSKLFLYWITDSIAFDIDDRFPQLSFRVGMQGMTNITCRNGVFGHNAFLRFNTNDVGLAKWNGQNSAVLQTTFNISIGGQGSDIPLYTQSNKFEIGVTGDNCSTDLSDVIRINWFELDYYRLHRVRGTYFNFKSNPNVTGLQNFYLYRWFTDNMKIYIPQRGELIANPRIDNDADQSVYFADTISERTEYFCVADDNFLLPDSIVKDISSDLRSASNKADYIIITHPDFMEQAKRLAEYRSNNLRGYTSPSVKVVDVFDIYDEFSDGLLNPQSLQDFVKYTYEKWQSPAPSYVAILGDMSSDFRGIRITSRQNFVPSILYHAEEFGQLPSDNLIVAVAGDDMYPDMAIGRLTCESPEEAEILVDKIINYPADNSKSWKNDVLLMASGLSEQDQINFGFNRYSNILENNYLVPNGVKASKVFNYPVEAADLPYKGSGPRMREEFNEGVVIANYYGHGGGGQWDLVFTNDDIYELQNENRLPIVLSITCYTAHFDNTDSFGEKFIKASGKGAVGFWGSAGLTFWYPATVINGKLYNHIFNNKEYVIGNAIMAAKADIESFGTYTDMLAQLSYLGDPAVEIALPEKPDFSVSTNSISVSPENPVVDDTVLVKVVVTNAGIISKDSVYIRLFDNSASDENLIGEKKIKVFAYSDSVFFTWVPDSAMLHTLIVHVNDKDIIDEQDLSDNTASNTVAVFSFSKPNIIKPYNGYYTNSNTISFIISDIGNLLERNFKYLIEIDTSVAFNSTAKIKSPELSPVNSIVSWKTGSLNSGQYFWHAYMYDNQDTNQTGIQTISIVNEEGTGYLSSGKQLSLLNSYNMVYSDSSSGLLLSTEVLPPRPSELTLQDSVIIVWGDGAKGITTFTTDGTYYYYGHLAFYTFGGTTKVYKIGTGLNGTEKGKNYGAVPNLDVAIKNQMFCHSDGYLYINEGYADKLLKVNPETGDKTEITISAAFLPSLDGLLKNQGYYLTSDGKYVYNITPGYNGLRNKYTVRIFDPADSWHTVGKDIILSGSSDIGFSSFFVANDYVVTYESYNSGNMRRYRLSDGTYEEEWLSYNPFNDYYAYCYDWINNNICASTFRPNNVPHRPGFHRFTGIASSAHGNISSTEIGPASGWNNIEYDIEGLNTYSKITAQLLGKNSITQAWEVLKTGFAYSSKIDTIDAIKYPYLKTQFSITDSSSGKTDPLVFKKLKVGFESLPEFVLDKNKLTFQPDSMLQGLPVTLSLGVSNIGYKSDTVNISMYLGSGDAVLASHTIVVPKDSVYNINEVIPTNALIFGNKVKVVASSPAQEFYTYNNIAENSFYVIRDSLRPQFTITFDGKELLNEDIISARPEVLITLKDNSPLPLDTSYFTLVHNNEPLTFNSKDVEYSYTPYPNSEFTIKWTPELEDGQHTLEVLAKDASSNFFDSTSSRSVFYVYNNDDLLNVYNYPNPFKNDTYFTFELRGIDVPDEFKIRIYTIAGRLIRDIAVPQSGLNIGFNKIPWDGRDQDGDEIANGLYLYKILSTHNGKTKSAVQKLVKLK